MELGRSLYLLKKEIIYTYYQFIRQAIHSQSIKSRDLADFKCVLKTLKQPFSNGGSWPTEGRNSILGVRDYIMNIGKSI